MSKDTTKNKKKLIIIGAGPAGLCCAYRMLERSDDFDITIIESDNVVGGISKTVIHNNNRIDMGGHRFFTKSQEVKKFWDDILPLQGRPAWDDILTGRIPSMNPYGADPKVCDKLMLHRRRVSRIYYKNKFFDYPISLKPSTILNLGIIQTVRIAISYMISLFFKKRDINLENFYINRFGKHLYNLFFKDYTQKLWGKAPKDISSDWGKQRVKGLSIGKIVVELLFGWTRSFINWSVQTSLIDSFYYPKYGPGQLYTEVLDRILKHGVSIRYNTQVTRLILKDNKIKALYCHDSNGNEFKLSSDIVVSSMPLKDLLINTHMEDTNQSIPQSLIDIASGLEFRSLITVEILVSKLKIKNTTKIKTVSDIPPDCWIYIQDKGVKLGRVQILNNWSPYLLADPLCTVCLGLEYFCNENDSFYTSSDKDIIELGIKELIQIGLLEDRSNVIDSCCFRVAKAYPAYFGTYKDIKDVINFINCISNLYCIGRNGQHRYNNMDHSILTAFRCVDSILDPSISKDEIWNVNTEKAYHESNS